ncbi:Coatomer subunit zeta-2 [Sesamum angolense]|uniref:Coatomer subunit zeta-2 n=1 Tax=Sesamum angolense TaxID=2727404 RepID=A0AAE1WTP6_9LAMI|nr:Coatomer subunit zeta-2 [Sesamum angolense]
MLVQSHICIFTWKRDMCAMGCVILGAGFLKVLDYQLLSDLLQPLTCISDVLPIAIALSSCHIIEIKKKINTLIILETDANSIASKVASHSIDSGAPLSEQTISQALATAREHLARSLLK